MTIWWLAVALGCLAASGLAFIWVAVRLGRTGTNAGAKKGMADSLEDAAKEDVEHIFNDQFREELRNRGRLHFEKIIGENAMFLQQDLRLTTSQLNEYMKAEITAKLQDEFAKYEQSIMDAKQLAIESIEKTNTAVEEQRTQLGEQLRVEVEAQKKHLMANFEANMADVVNHYVLAAVGNQIDLSDQLEYILGELEANKEAILERISKVAHEANLVLPNIAVGRTDVVRLQRELEALGDYLHQAALRKTPTDEIKLPKTSRLLDEFVTINKFNLLHREDHDTAVKALQDIVVHAPRLHVSFSTEPSSAFLAKLVGWMRQNLGSTVLVQVGLQPGIAAGCIVRTPNKQFDLSLGQSFRKNRELLLSQLRGEVVTNE